MLQNLADFALQEQAEDNLMVAFSSAWYNGSYTIAAKPIKSLELHYTMIQFLIITFIIQHIVTLPKYGHGELNICRPHMTDILRYT